jgi:hypothetical protein
MSASTLVSKRSKGQKAYVLSRRAAPFSDLDAHAEALAKRRLRDADRRKMKRSLVKVKPSLATLKRKQELVRRTLVPKREKTRRLQENRRAGMNGFRGPSFRYPNPMSIISQVSQVLTLRDQLRVIETRGVIA